MSESEKGVVYPDPQKWRQLGEQCGEKLTICDTFINEIRNRIEAVLEGKPGDMDSFPVSALSVVGPMCGDIISRSGSVVVKNPDDEYGNALLSRDGDGRHWTIAELTGNATIEVAKIPCNSTPETPQSPDEVRARTERGDLKFEYTPAKTMAVAQNIDGNWNPPQFIPAGSLEVDPLADRYGQSIFGGSRAVRLLDGRVALFRPDAHAKRFINNSDRVCMPQMSEEQLVGIFRDVVLANMEYIGRPGEQSLYVAPGLRASKNQLGVKPNNEYLFTCLGVPAGKIFSKPAELVTETEFHRAARGGFGDVKHAGNYDPTFAIKKRAHKEGFDDLVFLDERNEVLRELSSSNIFFVTKNGILVTPDLSGEILLGITRDSILCIAEEFIEQGIINGVQSRPVRRTEFIDMAEGFSCGTGVTMNGIESITDAGSTYNFDISREGMGEISKMIALKFNSILAGEEINNPRYKDWLMIVK